MSEVVDFDELAGAEACFAAASRLLYCEPNVAEVAAQAATRQFAAAPFAASEPRAAQGLALMDAWCREAAASAGLAAGKAPDAAALGASPAFCERVDALKREWLRLFAGAGAPEASCLESFYVEPNSHMFGSNTLAVREAYRRHGLQIERLHAEPDDHLGLMVGFIGYLIGEELTAREEGGAETARCLESEQGEFLTGHVLPWLAAWRFRVERHASSDYFRGAGDFVFGLCACYARRFGIVFSEQDEVFRRVR